MFILSSFQLSSKQPVVRTGKEVQWCLKCPSKSILYFGIFTMSYCGCQKKQAGGCKFDICEANICCYRNNCHFILFHKATINCFEDLKKDEIHKKWSSSICLYISQSNRKQEKLTNPLEKIKRDFKAARLVWLTQEPCSTVKTLCESLK